MTSTETPTVNAVDHPSRWLRAQYLRVGTQVMTDDGWQTVRGLVIFEDADQVSVFTDQRDDVWTDGWRFRFDQVVQWRRGAAAGECPSWCTDHYDGGEQDQVRNHSSFPHSVNVVEVYTGQPRELGVWLERRDYRDTGSCETVGVLETRLLAEDVELTPDQMRRLAQRLQTLADRADAGPEAK